MSEANAHCGEILVNLLGNAFVLRPSFAALAAMEAATGVGLITLARQFASGGCTLAHMVALLKAGIEGAGGTAPDNLGELVAQSGVAQVAGTLSQFLAQALSGQPDPKA